VIIVINIIYAHPLKNSVKGKGEKMKKYLLIAVIILMSSLFSSVRADEADARKMFLDASALVRDGKYQDAKQLLDQILKDYPTSEVAIKADEKLTEVLAKIEESKLPQIPGVYIRNTSGELIKLAMTENIGKAQGLDKSWKDLSGKNLMDYMMAKEKAPYYSYILWLAKYPEIPADEIESFIAYLPDVKELSNFQLCFVQPATGDNDLAWTAEEPDYSKGKAKYLIYSDWNLTVKQESINSANLIKKTLKDGIYQISSPKILNFGAPANFCLTVQGTQAFPFIIQPTLADVVMANYYVKGAKADEGIGLLDKKLQQQKEDPKLNLVKAELLFLNDKLTEASEISNRMLAGTDKSYQNDFTDLSNRIKYKTIMADVNTNYMGSGANYEEGLTKVQSAIDLRPDSHEAIFLKAKLQAMSGKMKESIASSDQAFQIAKRTQKSEKKTYESFRDSLMSEDFQSQALSILNSGQNLDIGIKAAKDAIDKDENSYKAIKILAQLYSKAGKVKDAKKNAEKALKKAREKNAPDLADYEQLFNEYSAAADKK
jgi:hypothetical protein